MPAISYIGATISVFVGIPATIDAAGFGALSYVTVGEIVSWGVTGDTTEDIGIPKLSGRNFHVNGLKDGGSIPFTVQWENADAGQNIMRAQNNGNNDVSFRILDPDGRIEYSFGRIANLQQMERAAGNYKGFTGEARINSATITV